MSGCREIITIQLGKYANHVGAHFWNVQELGFDYSGTKRTIVDHSALYRAGETDGRPTYTPRLVIAELRRGLGSLSAAGGLEPQTDPADLVQGQPTETVREPAAPQNDYLKYINGRLETDAEIHNFDFEANVKTWTDYLFPRFHPRTINVVRDYGHGDDGIPFDIFHTGVNVWNDENYSEPFADSLRKYSEECDNFQGFQILLDSTDGFAGLADGCLRHLNDEYPNKAILALPLIASHFADDPETADLKDSTRLANVLLAYQSAWEHSSLFVPLCCGERGWRRPGRARRFPETNYDPTLDYHSSAVIASHLDTLSIVYRRKGGPSSLPDLCADLTGYGRKMAAAGLGLPFRMREHKYLIETLDDKDLEMFTSITPGCKIGNEKMFQYVTARGIPEDRLKLPLNRADKQIRLPAYRCETVKEMFEFYFECNYYATATNVTTSAEGLEIKMPFPRIFSKDLNAKGLVKEFEDDEAGPESVPVVAGYHNGNFLFDTLESLCREAKRIKIQKLHRFSQEGLEADDYNECLNRMLEIQSYYQDDYEL